MSQRQRMDWREESASNGNLIVAAMSCGIRLGMPSSTRGLMTGTEFPRWRKGTREARRSGRIAQSSCRALESRNSGARADAGTGKSAPTGSELTVTKPNSSANNRLNIARIIAAVGFIRPRFHSFSRAKYPNYSSIGLPLGFRCIGSPIRGERGGYPLPT